MERRIPKGVLDAFAAVAEAAGGSNSTSASERGPQGGAEPLSRAGRKFFRGKIKKQPGVGRRKG